MNLAAGLLKGDKLTVILDTSSIDLASLKLNPNLDINQGVDGKEGCLCLYPDWNLSPFFTSASYCCFCRCSRVADNPPPPPSSLNPHQPQSIIPLFPFRPLPGNQTESSVTTNTANFSKSDSCRFLPVWTAAWCPWLYEPKIMAI